MAFNQIVLLAAIATIPPTLAILVLMGICLKQKRDSARHHHSTQVKVEEVHGIVNSRYDSLVEQLKVANDRIAALNAQIERLHG
jgi:hypothetical protein